MKLYYVVVDEFYYDGVHEEEQYAFDILSVCTDENSARRELKNKYKELNRHYGPFATFRIYEKDTNDKTPLNFCDMKPNYTLF